MQRALKDVDRLHVAIIMDGNGRWAERRGLPRLEGHRAGANAVRRCTEAAPRLGIGTLTLYAFSSDNWRRPRAEVDGLMRLLRIYVRRETARCVENGVRVRWVGRRDRVSPAVRRALEGIEATTAPGRTLDLRIALDYSARDALVEAARCLGVPGIYSREELARALGDGDGAPSPDVDLLIRTGGEQRLSDFLLWESAYAELLFTDRMWPEFGPDDLAGAIAAFRARERRFGALPATQAAG